MGLSKYIAVFKINLLESINYRFDLVFRSISSLFYLLAFIYLWTTIYKMYEIDGFSLTALIWYFLMVQTIRSASGRPVREISEQIQKGIIGSVQILLLLSRNNKFF